MNNIHLLQIRALLMRALRMLPAVSGLLLAATVVQAHHSFAVFFDSDRTVTQRGTVVDFQFRNPHGLIRLKVVDQDGKESIWNAETQSTSIRVRRG